MHTVKSIITGSVWEVIVSIGEKVERGQDVVIIESMKMEIPAAAEASGIVKDIKVSSGDFVDEGDVLVIIE